MSRSRSIRTRFTFVVALAVLTVSAAALAISADAPPPAHDMHAMPDAAAARFDNLGKGHHAISTRSAEAQRYFDQGLDWMWAFNLEEAQRSFETAARLDSSCAMCW
jgi:hypothetical protein